MVDVDHQDQVDFLVGKLGVGLGREDAFDVGDAGLRALFLSISSISGWTSVARTVPVGTDPAGQTNAVIAGPGPHVGHGRSSGDLEGAKHRLGLLFFDAGFAEQPVDPFPRHHIGDRPAHVSSGRVRLCLRL